MAYQDLGEGYPLLMGHSFLWDSAMWAPQIACLKENYRCIAPDLWSHGESALLPPTTTTLEHLANDFWQLSQTLSLQKFALIGLSVGGMWATHMALSHPESISALVLMDTFVGPEPAQTQTIYFAMMDELAKEQKFTPAFADKVAPFFFAKNTAYEQPELVNSFIQSLLNTPFNHIDGKVTLGRAIFARHSLMEKLSNIKVPTLIVVGEEDIPRPVKEAQEMVKCIPHAELAIIPRAGHICTLEQPALVNEILSTFLQKHCPKNYSTQ